MEDEPDLVQSGGGHRDGGAPPGVREHRALEHRSPRHSQSPPSPGLGPGHNLPLQVRHCSHNFYDFVLQIISKIRL